jgi:hypothetical protein
VKIVQVEEKVSDVSPQPGEKGVVALHIGVVSKFEAWIETKEQRIFHSREKSLAIGS